jgi:hypothetical protein
MKRLLLVRPEAEGDLASARDWYEQKSTGLGLASREIAGRGFR